MTDQPRVKTLEWKGSNYADTPFGEYSVDLDEDDAMAATPWCAWSPAEGGTNLGHFATVAQAEAQCQADYEQRGRAIYADPPMPGRGEGFDLALIEATVRKFNKGRSEDHIKSVALDTLTVLRDLAASRPKEDTHAK